MKIIKGHSFHMLPPAKRCDCNPTPGRSRRLVRVLHPAGEWLQFPTSRNTETVNKVRDEQFIDLPLDGSVSLEEMEKMILAAALERSNHSVSAAARCSGPRERPYVIA